MEHYKKILVCIDRPERDESMLQYTKNIAATANSDEIHLLHVTPHYWENPEVQFFPYAGGVMVPPLSEPGQLTDEEKQVLNNLKRIGEDHFGSLSQTELICDVISGSPLYEIIQYTMDKDIDLVVVGRHFGAASQKGDKAVLARRITRKATCSVLTLPEDCMSDQPKILVPARNSECSSNALEEACSIAAAQKGDVEVLNVYQVYSGYVTMSTDLKKHLDKLQSNAKQECSQLIERSQLYDVQVSVQTFPDFDHDPVPVILARLNRIQGNLIVIGARGRTGTAGVLLGTITEQLIKKSPAPVLAVKKKGECLTFVKALLNVAGIKPSV